MATTEIKLFEAIRIETEKSAIDCASPAELWSHIKVPDELKTEVLRYLMCFHTLDLTAACNGHKCILSIVPCKD